MNQDDVLEEMQNVQKKIEDATKKIDSKYPNLDNFTFEDYIQAQKLINFQKKLEKKSKKPVFQQQREFQSDRIALKKQQEKQKENNKNVIKKLFKGDANQLSNNSISLPKIFENQLKVDSSIVQDSHNSSIFSTNINLDQYFMRSPSTKKSIHQQSKMSSKLIQDDSLDQSMFYGPMMDSKSSIMSYRNFQQQNQQLQQKNNIKNIFNPNNRHHSLMNLQNAYNEDSFIENTPLSKINSKDNNSKSKNVFQLKFPFGNQKNNIDLSYEFKSQTPLSQKQQNNNSFLDYSRFITQKNSNTDLSHISSRNMYQQNKNKQFNFYTPNHKAQSQRQNLSLDFLSDDLKTNPNKKFRKNIKSAFNKNIYQKVNEQYKLKQLEQDINFFPINDQSILVNNSNKNNNSSIISSPKKFQKHNHSAITLKSNDFNKSKQFIDFQYLKKTYRNSQQQQKTVQNSKLETLLLLDKNRKNVKQRLKFDKKLKHITPKFFKESQQEQSQKSEKNQQLNVDMKEIRAQIIKAIEKDDKFQYLIKEQCMITINQFLFYIMKVFQEVYIQINSRDKKVDMDIPLKLTADVASILEGIFLEQLKVSKEENGKIQLFKQSFRQQVQKFLPSNIIDEIGGKEPVRKVMNNFLKLLKEETAFWSDAVEQNKEEIFQGLLEFLSGNPQYEKIKSLDISRVEYYCYKNIFLRIFPGIYPEEIKFTVVEYLKKLENEIFYSQNYDSESTAYELSKETYILQYFQSTSKEFLFELTDTLFQAFFRSKDYKQVVKIMKKNQAFPYDRKFFKNLEDFFLNNYRKYPMDADDIIQYEFKSQLFRIQIYFNLYPFINQIDEFQVDSWIQQVRKYITRHQDPDEVEQIHLEDKDEYNLLNFHFLKFFITCSITKEQTFSPQEVKSGLLYHKITENSFQVQLDGLIYILENEKKLKKQESEILIKQLQNMASQIIYKAYLI